MTGLLDQGYGAAVGGTSILKSLLLPESFSITRTMYVPTGIALPVENDVPLGSGTSETIDSYGTISTTTESALRLIHALLISSGRMVTAARGVPLGSLACFGSGS